MTSLHRILAPFAASIAVALHTRQKQSSVQCQTALEGVDPPHWHRWPHEGPFSAFDVASLRRGFEVYRQVCSSCHSLQYVHFRQLVGVTHTEAQAKALARSYTRVDGPDAEGKMFERPCTLADSFPSPYPNEEFARFVNNGLYPPDLSWIVNARHRGEDYLLSLLGGYHDPPAGVVLRESMYYNVYFPGNALGMPPPLESSGVVEYEDNTVATPSQMAKDVSCFLTWTSKPEQDERKKNGVKVVLATTLLAAVIGYRKRFYWSTIKSQRIRFHPPGHSTGYHYY